MMCVGFLNCFYFLTTKGGNFEIHTVHRDSNNIMQHFLIFSMCRSVGLSSCRTIESSDYRYEPYMSFKIHTYSETAEIKFEMP